MQLSLNWLKDFVDIPKSVSPEELGARLTLHTVEVEEVLSEADKYKNVVVGKILEIKKHPNADRLQLAKVDIGAKKLNIVCGASNIEVGQLIPVALVGAILPNGLEIKEAEVRGEKSSGMLCAADELGLGDDHSGILILEKRAKIGQDFADYLGLKDTVFILDNKSLSNRPDLWSHYGIAREISTIFSLKLKEIKANKKILEKSANGLKLKVKIEDFNFCPRYMALALTGIKIEQSPDWLKERLVAAGMRPLNNIVDITNYVMLELGQPMHAFDADFLGSEIVIRPANKGEKIETLDGEKRNLSAGDILIADGKKSVAIAGVMGGANSEINDNTKTIVLESANFNYVSIRKTSTHLGLRTESSMRFEKGLDPNLCELALARAVELINKVCPEVKVASNLIDEKKFKLNQEPVEINLDWLEGILGVKMEEKKIIKILTSLGFGVEKKRASLQIIIPTWRATRDIQEREDIAEEIIRIYGYENLKPIMPKIEMSAPEINEEKKFEREIKNILAGAPALTEIYNYSFVGEEQLKKLDIDCSKCLRLANPIAAHQALLRQELAPNIFYNIKDNQGKFERIAIFEIGSVYFSNEGTIFKDSVGKEFLPYQEKRLAIAFAQAGEDNFRKVKGIIDYLVLNFNLKAVYKKSAFKPDWAEKGVCADIEINKKNVGIVARLSSACAGKINIKREVVLAEINLAELFSLVKAVGDNKYKGIEKYPSVIRDLSFVVDANILYNDINKEISNFSEMIKEVDLFDVYEGGKLGAGKKSLAFHIVYQADRTLTSEEVDKMQDILIGKLEKKFGAKIRNF